MESDKYPQKLVFGLDIGTRSIVGTVGYRENRQFIVVAQSIREHETRAMIDGQIHDIGKVSETIREVKADLESQLEITLTDVCIAAAGRVLKTVKVKSEYEFSNETTVNEDHIRSLDLMGVEKAYHSLRDELRKEKISFYCVGYSVINYSLNGYTMFNLNGHKATRIGAEILATFLPDEVINGLYAAVEGAKLQVASLTLEPIAAINIAIPENYRLLNIAMVDVGAGTSDISITKDGSIIAYGMIPNAGDEITEAIAEKYLVDFAVAEKLKTSCLRKKNVSFKNIMGISYKLSTDEVIESVTEIVHKITKSIADKIIELNGDKTVSAVFVVGGGGKIPGFITSLAEYLELPQERVALRGEDVLKSVTFLHKDFKKDSLMVTPIGICLNYYDNSNNFIFVNVNEERVKLYDNGKLTISDAAVQLGYSNEQLFPKHGRPLTFLLNGSHRTIKGSTGEAAAIRLNGETVGITHEIKHNDKIEIIESTAGKAAEIEIHQLPEYKNTLFFTVCGSHIQCPKPVLANKEMVSEFYSIKENDEIKLLDYYTVKQLIEYTGIELKGEILVNQEPADMDKKIYENDSIQCNPVVRNKTTEPLNDNPNSDNEPADSNYESPDIHHSTVKIDTDAGNLEKESKGNVNTTDVERRYVQETSRQEYPDDWFLIKPKDNPAKPTEKEADTPAWYREYSKNSSTDNDKAQDSLSPYKMNWQANNSMVMNQAQQDSAPAQNTPTQNNVMQDNIKPNNITQNTVKQKENLSQDIYVTINSEVVKMSNKPKYIYVDIFDFYSFDLSSMKGTELVTLLNGERVDFTAPLKDSDKIEIFWKK